MRGDMAHILGEVDPRSLGDNPFALIGDDWMLITAGTLESYNTMTASWGGLGVLWNKNVCFCFVRPTRHTYTFMEDAQRFTLSFFGEEYRAALNYCGSHTGKNVDKAKEAGITPASTESGAVYFAEARLVLECEKIYFQDMLPRNFLAPGISKLYPQKDYHRMYVGGIVRCLRA